MGCSDFQVCMKIKMVFADEVDRVLNPILERMRMIAFINGKRCNGQFVFFKP